MNAREEILGRIRQSLRDLPEGRGPQDTPIDWTYGQPTPMPDVLERFAEAVRDYRATVVVTPATEVPQRIVEALRELGAESVVVPSGAHESWAHAVHEAGITILRDDPALSHDQLDAAGAVVTAAAVGIAETGTIVLDHGPDQGRRALSLVPDIHICVVLTPQVVSDVPEAVARLRAAVVEHGQPLTWISGPSATSDIELDRVEGVHGPRTLHVILAG